ncbi:hypothetical protein N431DRAFT_553320 [Stipitochalara longipes BDJ]|nr:hypothetical protein N431DRAFT_553320 [Stipitochalara longipes BDJ]
MASYWNPRQLLDVYPQQPHFTCVGTTLRGPRCRQSFLKNIHKAEADRLLDLLPPPEQFRSHPSELFPTLRHIAWLTLCPRWHQNGARCQADAVAAKWLQIISSSTSTTTTYTYGGFQAPTTFPLSPPQSPLPAHRTFDAAVPSSQTYYTYPAAASASIPYSSPPAVLPLSPPLSPSQGIPGAAAQNGNGASNANILPQISSSIRTTDRDGSTRIDISITVVRDQPTPSHPTGRGSRSVSTTAFVSNQVHPRIQTPSLYPRSSQASTHSTSSSSLANSRIMITRDVQDILSRLESLERQAVQFQNGISPVSSRASRQSFVASSRSFNDPRSPIGSAMSDLYLPPPIGNPELYFSPPRSPAPTPHTGSLSISTDSESTSSVVIVNTPASSRSSTPVILSATVTPAATAIGVLGLATPQAGVQRRPITTSTTCYVCDDHFQSPSDAVWCRGTCGQNLCFHCFDRWIETQDGLSITCPFCRQPWVF